MQPAPGRAQPDSGGGKLGLGKPVGRVEGEVGEGSAHADHKAVEPRLVEEEELPADALEVLRHEREQCQ